MAKPELDELREVVAILAARDHMRWAGGALRRGRISALLTLIIYPTALVGVIVQVWLVAVFGLLFGLGYTVILAIENRRADDDLHRARKILEDHLFLRNPS